MKGNTRRGRAWRRSAREVGRGLVRASLFLVLIVLSWSACTGRALADPLEVEVTGVEDDPADNVMKALALPPGLVSEGKVDQLWLERFAIQAKEKAQHALEPFGYYKAQVTTKVEPRGEGEFLLLVRVVPGAPVVVSAATVRVTGAGSGEGALAQLVRSFPLTPGQVLLQTEYEKFKASLKSAALDRGYLDADYPRHEIRISPDLSTARIELVLETGARYFFDGVTIEGAPKYPEPFLRRYVSFKSGETFSYGKLGETQLNFTNAERFKEVVITPQKEQAKDFQVPVLVKLTPAPRRTVRPGIGFGTDTGLRFTLRYRDLDLFRAGHELDSNLYISENLQGLATRYLIPSPRDIRTSTTLQLNLQQENVTAYISRLVALELDRNRSFGKGKVGTAYLRLQQEGFTIGNQDSSSRLVLPGLRFSEDHFDNMVRPTRGYHYMVDVRGAHPFFGSDVGLIQGIAEGLVIQPLFWRMSVRLRGSAAGSLLSDPLADVPPTLRFFAGGDQSVRGYSYKSLGPHDSSGQVVGGRDLLVGSIELERALFQNWGVSAFFDAGNAYNDLANMRLQKGTGVGVHYYSPVGAINLAVATRVESETQAIYIHFSVGFEL